MKVFSSQREIVSLIAQLKNKKKTIGFVPTMGALHKGHLSLINKANKLTDFCIVSIFVNKAQFNDKNDYETYPRTLKKDINLLKNSCDVLFTPSHKEMYKNLTLRKYNLGFLTASFEGFNRPNHFDGVITIVQKLFDIINPTLSLFGEKDFQQFLIIQKFFKKARPDIKILNSPTIREDSGLALSSRNSKLSKQEKKQAPIIFKALNKIAKEFSKKTIKESEEECNQLISSIPNSKIDYVAIVNAENLIPINKWDEAKKCKIICAVTIGKIRLIDNLTIF